MSLAYAGVRIQISKNKPKALSPDDFNPFAKAQVPIPSDITVLKALLPPHKRPKKK